MHKISSKKFFPKPFNVIASHPWWCNFLVISKGGHGDGRVCVLAGVWQIHRNTITDLVDYLKEMFDGSEANCYGIAIRILWLNIQKGHGDVAAISDGRGQPEKRCCWWLGGRKNNEHFSGRVWYFCQKGFYTFLRKGVIHSWVQVQSIGKGWSSILVRES